MKMLIEKFMDYLEFEKRYSKNTIISYQSDLEKMRNYLLITYQIDSVEKIGHVHIRSWMVNMMQASFTSKSLNRKISTLKSFFKFLKRINKVSKNPMNKIVSPKMGKRLPEYIQEKNISRLFDQSFEDLESSEIRNILIVEMLYITGMRRTELIHLKRRDIDFHNGQIKVLGKGNKERLIPINKTFLQKLNKYIEAFPSSSEEPYLFLTDKGKKMYDKLVYNIVKQELSKISTAKKKSPHILRHTFATHLSNNGAELNAIKELLGHANLSATQIYTHNTIDKLQEVYKNAHPKA